MSVVMQIILEHTKYIKVQGAFSVAQGLRTSPKDSQPIVLDGSVLRFCGGGTRSHVEVLGCHTVLEIKFRAFFM